MGAPQVATNTFYNAAVGVGGAAIPVGTANKGFYCVLDTLTTVGSGAITLRIEVDGVVVWSALLAASTAHFIFPNGFPLIALTPPNNPAKTIIRFITVSGTCATSATYHYRRWNG